MKVILLDSRRDEMMEMQWSANPSVLRMVSVLDLLWLAVPWAVLDEVK